MSLTQYYTATTLDGFIAAPDDSLDWLFTRRQDRDGPLNYDQFVADVGAAAMGATTYGWLPNVELTSDDVRDVHGPMVEAAAGRNVWIIGGGDLAGQFADAGLLDEVIVYIASATLGDGKPLLPRRLELRLEETARNGDFVAARYSVPG